MARGGMGAILRATDLSIERTVAMKIALKHAVTNEVILRRFTQETKFHFGMTIDDTLRIVLLKAN